MAEVIPLFVFILRDFICETVYLKSKLINKLIAKLGYNYISKL